ncbi:MAG: hypothetical protein O3A88_03680 [Proteobacteria bacterium]|nr:hypothetical protein [Pseudomonadota bacterium]
MGWRATIQPSSRTIETVESGPRSSVRQNSLISAAGTAIATAPRNRPDRSMRQAIMNIISPLGAKGSMRPI